MSEKIRQQLRKYPSSVSDRRDKGQISEKWQIGQMIASESNGIEI